MFKLIFYVAAFVFLAPLSVSSFAGGAPSDSGAEARRREQQRRMEKQRRIERLEQEAREERALREKELQRERESRTRGCHPRNRSNCQIQDGDENPWRASNLEKSLQADARPHVSEKTALNLLKFCSFNYASMILPDAISCDDVMTMLLAAGYSESRLTALIARAARETPQ